jgi:hypothetical protein
MAKGAKKKDTGGRERKRATFVVFSDTKRKLDYISMMDQEDLSDIAEKAFLAVIEKYEKKNGPIPTK